MVPTRALANSGTTRSPPGRCTPPAQGDCYASLGDPGGERGDGGVTGPAAGTAAGLRGSPGFRRTRPGARACQPPTASHASDRNRLFVSSPLIDVAESKRPPKGVIAMTNISPEPAAPPQAGTPVPAPGAAQPPTRRASRARRNPLLRVAAA